MPPANKIEKIINYGSKGAVNLVSTRTRAG